MTVYRQGDIVLVPFPFTDQSQSKPRPAVVVSATWWNTGARQDFILAAITSQISQSQPTDVFIEDWRSAGLVKPSIVKTTKIFTMQKNLVLKSLGHLHPETMREVISNIKTVLDDQPR